MTKINSQKRMNKNMRMKPLVAFTTAVVFITTLANSSMQTTAAFSSMTTEHRATAAQQRTQHVSPLNSFSSVGEDWSFDEEAYELKNQARKKFGLKPLSTDEFMAIQAQVKQLEVEQIQKMEIARQQLQQQKAKKEQEDKKKQGSLFAGLTKLVGNVLEDTCESNYDCERPQVCCDLGFKRMCCASGQNVFDLQGQQQMIPIRVIADGGGPGGRVADY